MKPNTLARCLLLVAFAAPMLGSGEDDPFFSLSSYQTFGTHDKPAVQLTAWNVNSLEFRIYRVADPVQFFKQLDDPHQFGGSTPRVPHTRTMLERIHGWKRSLRARILRGLRGQFTEPPSNHIASLSSHPTLPPAKGTHYAEAPVLNADQMVLTFDQPVRSLSRWDSTKVGIDVKDRGVYLVEAVNKTLRAYTILIVSDIVMTTKSVSGRTLSFVVDRNTGEPVHGASIWNLLPQGPTQSVETDADGVVETPLPAGNNENLRMVARRGADFTALTPGIYGAQNGTPWTGYIYTDRPVYRPGHTVHFRAILRQRTATSYDVPAAKPVSVEVRDPQQKDIYQKSLTTSANGTIHGEFDLPPTASLGSYTIQIHSEPESYLTGNFEVEEYKKPEYEVHVLPSKPRVLQGETVQFTIDSRYYFGEPVSGAQVKYTVSRTQDWFPLWYDHDDYENPANGPDDDSNGEQILQETGQLDQDGKLTITFPTTVSDHKIDYRYYVEARVTDEARREIVGNGSVMATYGSFLVNVTPERYFYKAGSKATFKVEARDYDNKPISTKMKVELVQWQRRERAYQDVKASTEATTNADGVATAELVVPAEDTYRVRVTAHTPENRDVEAYAYIWTPNAASEDYEEDQEKDIQIVPDQKSYRPGETARLLIMTGKSNTPVLATVEGRDLGQHKLIRSQESTALFEVPVAAGDEPGFFVSAQFVRGGVFYRGSKYIEVPPDDHRLNVSIATDKPQYQPGQSAQYKISITGVDGKPVPKAEFSLGVVDEAIYAIRRDSVEDPLRFFFGTEWNHVNMTDSMSYFFTGEAGQRRMRLAQLRRPSRLAQLKPDRLVLPKIRKAFPDTAFWAADITTDASGVAQTKVDFPDSLTTWRATARGVTPDTKVGAATLKTIVRKNLILRLAVPRFFVQGDEVVISALVHNYLATPKLAKVSLDLKGLDVIGGATKDVQVLSRSEVRVDWRVRAQNVRSVTILGKALTDEESDALELQLPVNVPGVKLSNARGGTLAPGATAAFDLAFPAKVAPGSRSIAVQVSPSIAGSLFGALEYLTSFPYGCVEQTMSSFLPNIIVTQAVHDLGLKVDLGAEMPQKIHAGLDRLYSMQHPDGGWGWWETDDSHPFMTAYVVAGLVQAQSAGIEINGEAVPKATAWLAAEFVKDPKIIPDLRAYMVYALAVAGHADANALGQVYGQRSQLTPYGLALLGLAMEQAKDSRAGDLATALEQGAEQDQEQAWWTAARDNLLDFSEDASPEATAFAVKFLSHQRPASALLPKAALWLMNHRNEGYWWASTKQTAMVIYGLTDFLKASNELHPNLNATVYVNDKPVLTRTLTDATSLTPAELILDESKVDPGVNHVRVTVTGQGRLYYSTRAEYFSTEEKLQKTGSVALNILREYYRLTPTKEGDHFVYETVPLQGPVAPGDTIAVRLTVTGSDWRYLLIEDPIPAGTEFIEKDKSYPLKNAPPWWSYFFTRREMHDDHMAIFTTFFPRGQKDYFYLLKVVNPGAFQMNPARVQPMYQPGVLSTTESRRLEVK